MSHDVIILLPKRRSTSSALEKLTSCYKPKFFQRKILWALAPASPEDVSKNDKRTDGVPEARWGGSFSDLPIIPPSANQLKWWDRVFVLPKLIITWKCSQQGMMMGSKPCYDGEDMDPLHHSVQGKRLPGDGGFPLFANTSAWEDRQVAETLESRGGKKPFGGITSHSSSARGFFAGCVSSTDFLQGD